MFRGVLISVIMALLLVGCNGGGSLPSVTPTPPATSTPEIITTASGLQYVDLKVGTGETPQPGDLVSVHYTGWLEDGTQFDSSHDRGDAFVFPVGQGMVIPGWDEGVSTMKVGGIRRLIIPSQLGYGETGIGGVIPPNARLTFEVELLAIQK